MPEIVRPFIIQFFLVLLDRFYQKAVSLKRSHAFLTGNRAACKSVAWESFLFGSFPGKQFFYDSDKVVNSCIYDYLRSQKLSGSLIIAEFLSLFTHFSTKLLRTSPLLLYEILFYPRLHSLP